MYYAITNFSVSICPLVLNGVYETMSHKCRLLNNYHFPFKRFQKCNNTKYSNIKIQTNLHHDESCHVHHT